MTDIPRHPVYLKPAAEWALKKILDRTTRRRIAQAIDGLTTTSQPAGAVTIQGSDGLLRIRVGDYRIIYTVDTTPHRAHRHHWPPPRRVSAIGDHRQGATYEI